MWKMIRDIVALIISFLIIFIFLRQEGLSIAGKIISIYPAIASTGFYLQKL